MSDTIRLRVDDILLILTKKTLLKYPDSILAQVVNSELTADFIHKDDNTLYLDMNPASVKIIVSYLRGYDISNTLDTELTKNILYDAKRLNLTKLVALLETPKIETHEYVHVKSPSSQMAPVQLTTMSALPDSTIHVSTMSALPDSTMHRLQDSTMSPLPNSTMPQNLDTDPIHKLALSITEEFDKIDDDSIQRGMEKLSNIFIKAKNDNKHNENTTDFTMQDTNFYINTLTPQPNDTTDTQKKIVRPRKFNLLQ
jgi:hypothetical protein